jgi:hypothetical protein
VAYSAGSGHRTRRSRRAGQAQLTERIKEIAATRVRYGYRRIHVLLGSFLTTRLGAGESHTTAAAHMALHRNFLRGGGGPAPER